MAERDKPGQGQAPQDKLERLYYHRERLRTRHTSWVSPVHKSIEGLAKQLKEAPLEQRERYAMKMRDALGKLDRLQAGQEQATAAIESRIREVEGQSTGTSHKQLIERMASLLHQPVARRLEVLKDWEKNLAGDLRELHPQGETLEKKKRELEEKDAERRAGLIRRLSSFNLLDPKHLDSIEQANRELKEHHIQYVRAQAPLEKEAEEHRILLSETEKSLQSVQTERQRLTHSK